MERTLAGAAVGSMLILFTATGVRAADPASAVDKAFVGKVSQGGMYEVEASKVAVDRATSANVKDQAIAEVHDHEGVGSQLKQIASETGVDVAGSLNAEFGARLEKLKATSGPGFDRAYIADMKLIHAKDEQLFAREAIEGSSAYKGFAHETDLIVKRHIGALNAPGTL